MMPAIAAPPAGPLRRRMFSLHGIRDAGHWQSDISHVFRAEFEHIPLRYREYHLGGALKMFLWPWSLVAAALAIFLATDFHPAEAVGLVLVLSCLLVLQHEVDWAGTNPWLLVPMGLGMLGVLAYLSDGAYRVDVLWLLLASLVLFQELREVHGDDGPRFDSWPVLAAAIVALGLPARYLGVWYVVLYGVSCLLVAYFEAARRRNFALRKVAANLRNQLRPGETVHWAAHSFGTYLTSRLLADSTGTVQFQHMVLFGGLVPEDFNWQLALLGSSQQRALVSQVRNEYGTRDWVVPLATLLRRWGRRNGYGRSGVDGFFASALVHKIPSAFGGCGTCLAPGVDPALHDVNILDYEHGTYLHPLHFRQLWLPFYWNYVPDRYEDFLRTCYTVIEHHNDRLLLGAALRFLLDSHWVWSPRQQPVTFKQCVESLLRRKLRRPPSAAQLQDALLRICQLVVTAIQELDRGDDADPAVLRNLRPTRAVMTALR
jgi:hypothetical protein